MKTGDLFFCILKSGDVVHLEFSRIDMFGDYEFKIDPPYQDMKWGSFDKDQIHEIYPISILNSPLMKALS